MKIHITIDFLRNNKKKPSFQKLYLLYRVLEEITGLQIIDKSIILFFHFFHPPGFVLGYFLLENIRRKKNLRTEKSFPVMVFLSNTLFHWLEIYKIYPFLKMELVFVPSLISIRSIYTKESSLINNNHELLEGLYIFFWGGGYFSYKMLSIKNNTFEVCTSVMLYKYITTL